MVHATINQRLRATATEPKGVVEKHRGGTSKLVEHLEGTELRVVREVVGT